MSNATNRLHRIKLRGRPVESPAEPGGGSGDYSGPQRPNMPSGHSLVINAPMNSLSEGWTMPFGAGFFANDVDAPFGPTCYEQRYSAGVDGGGPGGAFHVALPNLSTMYCALNVKFNADYWVHSNSEKLWYPQLGNDASPTRDSYPCNIYPAGITQGPDFSYLYRTTPQGDGVFDPFASGHDDNPPPNILKGAWQHIEALMEHGSGTYGVKDGRLRLWTNGILVVDALVAFAWGTAGSPLSNLRFRNFRLDDTRGGGQDLVNGPIPAQQSRFFSGLYISGISA